MSVPRQYNEDLTQLELELSRVPELAVEAENWESRQSKAIENNRKKGIMLWIEDSVGHSQNVIAQFHWM
jgi:hypothetical protein